MENVRLFADLILIVHVAYAVFVVGGQVLIIAGWIRGWSWTRRPVFRLAHLAAIGVVVAQSWLGLSCPLTVWEDALRRATGQEGYAAGFIAHWLSRLLFWSAPAWVFTVIYTALGLLVAATFLLYPPRRRANR